MISRSNYFRMVILMAVLCAIFFFTMYAREKGTIYDVNMFVVEEDKLPSGEDRWQATGEEEVVWFFGNPDTAVANTMKQWCTYTRRIFQVMEKLEEYSAKEDDIPDYILLDAQTLELGKNAQNLLPLTELGVPLIFVSLPEVSDILYSPNLKNILGIEEVYDGTVTVNGIRLFEGFFLNGAAEYEAKTEEEKERQDFELTVPWYLTSSGTKVYMVGILDKNEVEENTFPCLIWRNSYKDTKVFAVCGDYMSSLSGLGIMNAFVYELNSYDVYPVVNAQNVIINNFPNFSSENAEQLRKIYSREPKMVYQGLLWPSISAMAKTGDLSLTCMVKPQQDYTDGYEPKTEEVQFYLQQFRGIFAEAGRSLKHDGSTSFSTMLEKDNAFFTSLNSRYRYQTVFVEKEDLPELKQEIKAGGQLEEVVTVSMEYEAGDELLAYLTDDVTVQRLTGNAAEHTYRDDFELRSVQTALLYSNVVMDVYDAIWPQEEEDEWQLLYDKMSRNIYTYWRNKDLEKTTLSESDYRTRVFLNLDYSHQREENRITLSVENASEEAWFVLRTHDEKIVAITGGEYKELEKNAYLITVKEAVVEIEVEPLTLKELKE